MDQVTTNCQPKDQRGVCKWLQWLLIIQIISITYAMLSRAMNFGIFNEWLKLGISVGIPFCLNKLVCGHGFYRVPVTFLSIKVICTWLRLILSSSVAGWVLWILLICDTGAMLFELIAHSKLVKAVNQRLSKFWRWMAFAALLVSMGVFLLNVFVPDMLRLGTLDVELYQKILPLLNLPGMLIRIAYIVFLFQTEQMLQFAHADREEIL